MNDQASPAPPAPASRRIAAIDVGTNSIRLIVAEPGADGNYRVLDDEKVTARLGQGLHTTGSMSADAMKADCMKKADMETDAMKKKSMEDDCAKGAMSSDAMSGDAMKAGDAMAKPKQ